MTIEKLILKIAKMGNNACPTCATDFKVRSLERALMRLSGVSKVKVDEVTGKVTIEYDIQKIDVSKIIGRVEKLGYLIQNVSRGVS